MRVAAWVVTLFAITIGVVGIISPDRTAPTIQIDLLNRFYAAC